MITIDVVIRYPIHAITIISYDNDSLWFSDAYSRVSTRAIDNLMKYKVADGVHYVICRVWKEQINCGIEIALVDCLMHFLYQRKIYERINKINFSLFFFPVKSRDTAVSLGNL